MPAFKHRAVMLDPARLMDRKDQYDLLLPWLKRWGYNTLHLHFADDEGCRVVLPSHPDLAAEGAWTAEEMRTFVRRAKKLGLSVIPEIECFGHTAFITRRPGYRELGASPATGFNAINPRLPATRKLLKDLLTDVADIFSSSPVIHVGLDEVNLRVLPGHELDSDDQLAQVFARHTAWVHDQVRKLGRRPAMWGDHLLAAPKIADRLKKDVLIFDWHYSPHDEPANSGQTLRFFTDRGFEAWTSPSTLCWLSRVVTSAGNLANIRQLAATALLHKAAGVSGAVNTVWCPYRFLTGAMDYPIALGGHLFSAADEDPDFARQFAREFYGLSAGDARTCAEALGRLHAAAPTNHLYDRIILGKGWAGRFDRESRRAAGLLAQEATAVAGLLQPLVRRAKQHGDRLNDVCTSALILERVGQFGAANRRKRELPDGKALLRAAIRAWQRTRTTPWNAADYHSTSTQMLLPTLTGLT